MASGQGLVEINNTARRDIERRIGHALEQIERPLIYVVALFRVILAMLALVNTVLRVMDPI
jgi:hypothetical protein